MKIKLPTKAPKYYDWEVEYHNKITSFDPKDLTLHLEPEQEKGIIEGTVLAERLKAKAPNANVLEYLLKHPDLIPEDWKGKYVYFWGTIYRHPADDRLYVRYLYWDDGQWQHAYLWLDDIWGNQRPAALARIKTLEPSDLELRLLALEEFKKKVEKIINL